MTNNALTAVATEQQAPIAASSKRIMVTVPRLYQPSVVRELFNEMALTYRWHSLLGVGLVGCWRRQVVARLPLVPGQRVVDLMTGTGELWSCLLPRLGATGRIRAVDFSAAMLRAAARRRAAGAGAGQVSLYQANACCCGLATGSADIVVSAFGLKTLAPATYPALATEIARLLVPGGTVALVEMTVPVRGWRRALCIRYLQIVTWLVQAIGGPLVVHAQLLNYAQRFATLDEVAAACRAAGLTEVRTEKLAFGLASALFAQKPHCSATPPYASSGCRPQARLLAGEKVGVTAGFHNSVAAS